MGKLRRAPGSQAAASARLYLNAMVVLGAAWGDGVYETCCSLQRKNCRAGCGLKFGFRREVREQNGLPGIVGEENRNTVRGATTSHAKTDYKTWRRERWQAEPYTAVIYFEAGVAFIGRIREPESARLGRPARACWRGAGGTNHGLAARTCARNVQGTATM